MLVRHLEELRLARRDALLKRVEAASLATSRLALLSVRMTVGRSAAMPSARRISRAYATCSPAFEEPAELIL